jgi:hypothetical protein
MVTDMSDFEDDKLSDDDVNSSTLQEDFTNLDFDLLRKERARCIVEVKVFI